MTQQLKEMIERVKHWPAWRQADAAYLLQMMEKESGTTVYRLSDEERDAVREGLEEADRGEFVSDEEMEKFWNRHRI